MNEEPPNPSSEETYEQLELRIRKADVELYEGRVHAEKQRLQSRVDFESDYNRERIRQVNKYSNVAVALLIIDAFLLSSMVIFSFIAISYMHISVGSVVQIDGAATATIGGIFLIARWLYNKPNRFLEVARGNLSPQDNETLSSKIGSLLKSRSKNIKEVERQDISSTTIAPNNTQNVVEADRLMPKRIDKLERLNKPKDNTYVRSRKPQCPHCKGSESVDIAGSGHSGQQTYFCTQCNKSFVPKRQA